MNNMKKCYPQKLLFFCCCLFLTACYTAPPGKYFDIAVLNSNMLVGFAGEGMLAQLESPSVKMDGAGKPVAMKRSEVISTKIQFVEDSFKKVKGLKETGDTRDMLQTSLALYEYVLPVYKREYTQLAMLYDKHASKKLIESQAQAIHDKYYTGYEELYTRLINIGKSYAREHAIKVNW